MKPSVELAPASTRKVRRKGFHSRQQTKGKILRWGEKRSGSVNFPDPLDRLCLDDLIYMRAR